MSITGDDAKLHQAMATLTALPVQQLRCYRIVAEHRNLVEVAPNDAREALRKHRDGLWIDMQAVDPMEFKELLTQLDLHPLILEDCLDPHRSSRFSSYDTSLHFEFPVFKTESLDEYLSVVCVPRVLMTIRTARIDAVDEILSDFDKQVQLTEGTAAAVLHLLLDALGEHLLQSARGARTDIRHLSHLMDRDPDAVNIEEIISVKRRLQDISTVAEEQLYCIRSLATVDSKALGISSQHRDYVRDSVRNYETAIRVIHRYEARGSELHQQYQLTLQSRTESRIRILTILSSICMPLTLIAGVYGMNFARMPELQSSWGYPLTLLAMLLIAVGQLWFFYKRGWFG